MNIKTKKYIIIGFCAVIFLGIVWEVYIPKSLSPSPMAVYAIEKGTGIKEIAINLEKQGIIKSNLFFRLYVVISGQRSKLQAGSYNVSSSMSVVDIVKKIVLGDVIKNKITIIEGWDAKDIGKYLESKKLVSQKDFLAAIKEDFSQTYSFLKDKPKSLTLEGYLFPDTYEIILGINSKEVVQSMLVNFDKKLTPALRSEIASQHKSIFEIITMASILEKEVKSFDDKKAVSGILWKRIDNNIGLQVDSTINYITGKNDPRVAIKDTKIDSPYNTYKYRGLPLGPISNPGMDSILAAVYPAKSDYWYYLSADNTSKTIFSKTLQEHNAAVEKYLR